MIRKNGHTILAPLLIALGASILSACGSGPSGFDPEPGFGHPRATVTFYDAGGRIYEQWLDAFPIGSYASPYDLYSLIISDAPTTVHYLTFRVPLSELPGRVQLHGHDSDHFAGYEVPGTFEVWTSTSGWLEIEGDVLGGPIRGSFEVDLSSPGGSPDLRVVGSFDGAQSSGT